MTTSVGAVRFDDRAMWVELKDGRTVGVLLARFPRLLNATLEQRNAFEVTEAGLRWKAIELEIPLGRLLAENENALRQPIDWSDGSLLATEYTTLAAHYFHEDNYFLRAFGLFGTINTALLTLYGSNLIIHQQIPIQLAFIILGFVTTIAWSMSLIRVRYLRRKIENRIEEIEKAVQDYWHRTNNDPPFPLLRIRNRVETAKYFAERYPVSKVMRLIPIAFGVIWLGILAIFVIGLLRSVTSQQWLNAV